MLFRTTAARSIPRSLSTITTANSRSVLGNNAFRAPLNTFARSSKAPTRLSLVPRKPLATSLIRYQHNVSGITGGKSFEDAYAKEKVPATPQLVSTESSIHNVRAETGVDTDEHDVDMMAGIKSDFVCPHQLQSAPVEALGDVQANISPGRTLSWKPLHCEMSPKRLCTLA
jgi:hypothetical protein